jgi:hypothetical protein
MGDGFADRIEQQEAQPLRPPVRRSPGKAKRLSAARRLYVSVLSRNQAAFAPNFPLGGARRQLGLEYRMGLLIRPRLRPALLEEREAIGGSLRDSRRVAHAARVVEEPPWRSWTRMAR